MIPKILHYCWFGGKRIPKIQTTCIKSWEKYCKDYQIVKWDESRFEIDSNCFTKQAYDHKMWAFIADYVRLFALYNYGGIYLDSDVELVSGLNVFLNKKAFISFARPAVLSSALMGYEKNHPMIKKMINYYNDLKFTNPDGSLNMKPNTYIISDYYESEGLLRNNKFQIIGETHIYPQEYFAPTVYDDSYTVFTKNTCAIHKFTATWRDKKNFTLKRIKTNIKVQLFKIKRGFGII